MEHRVRDQRLLRLIYKWLLAGVSDEGVWSETTVGTPQGAVASPLLANVFLNYLLVLWMQWWRTNRCQGDAVVVRNADYVVIGFQSHDQAQACLEALRTRLATFGLKLREG